MALWLGRLIQIRRGEGQLALLGSGFFLLVQGAQAFGLNAGDTLLFQRYGVEVLPRLFIVLGVATLVTTTAYSAVVGRPDRTRLSLGILSGLALTVFVGWAVTFSPNPAVYPALWLGISLVSAVMGTMVWIVASEVCDTRQAKRLFALFASAGILGSVLAGLLTGPLARRLGAASLLPAAGTLILAGAAVGAILTRRHARRMPSAARPRAALTELRLAHRVVTVNPTMRLTAIASVVFSILYFAVAYPFNLRVAAAFPEEARLAGFLGTFGAVATGLTFLVSLLLASRLFEHLGVIGALLTLPLVYLLGFLLWSVRLDLATAALVRFFQLVVLGGVAGTAFSALFNVVPSEQRAPVRAFQAGPPAQAGVVLSGLLLLWGQRGLPLPVMLAIGLLSSLACLALVLRMRPAYAASLVEALRQGVTEVFTSSEAPFQSIRKDRQAQRVAERGLGDPEPPIRSISLTVLAELESEDSVPAIAAMAGDPSTEVRQAAVHALSRIGGQRSADAAVGFLEDADAEVRALALDASRVQGRDLERLIADPAPEVRARAAVLQAQGGMQEAAWVVIRRLLSDPRPEARRAGLDACADLGGPLAGEALVAGLRSPESPIRLQAARGLGRVASAEGGRALVRALEDPDPDVRRAAGSSLREIGELEPMLTVLKEGSPRAQDEIVVALEGRGSEARRATLEWTLRQIGEADRLRAAAAALPEVDPQSATTALKEILEGTEGQIEKRILQGLAITGPAQVFHTVERALASPHRDLWAQAVEALESVADRRVRRAIVDLLERSDLTRGPETAAAVLGELAGHPREWIRALALMASAETAPDLGVTLSKRAASDPSRIVQEAAALARRTDGGGRSMETARTLGLVERVLLLRRVPIFEHLEPEDLERIADVAGESWIPAGEYFWSEGDLGDELHVLVDGSVEVVKPGGDGPRLLRTLHVGQHLGELAILREQPRSASVRAREPSRTLVLSGGALRSILVDRPQVALAMLGSLAERLGSLA